MSSLFGKFRWWTEWRRKEDDLRQELQFHLEEETQERRADGLSEDQARWAAHRDLGNMTLLREDTRTLWTWTLLEQLAQDVRYALRTLFKSRAVSAFAVLSLALGIGANTAIYSFMDAILLRSLPVADPASLVVMTWRAKPFNVGSRAVNGSEFVLRSINGSFSNDATGASGRIFPFTAFERLQQASGAVLSSIFTYFPAGKVNVLINGDAELADGEYVSGDFFHGLAVSAAAGRLIGSDDDRAGAPSVAVVSYGYGQRRFGGAVNAVGQQILINNVSFTVAGVAPAEFFGVDPAAAPSLYLPMHANLLFDSDAAGIYVDQNYYWIGIMGRLRPGVAMAQAESALAGPFANWVATTATNDRERANLPVLRVDAGAGGLETLRRRYSKPLYVLLAMVALILAIACANTANLLLARAAARRREIAVRLSIGAGRFRLIRQMLTESIVLASLSGVLGILVTVAGMRLLTLLLANGDSGFTLHAELNRHVLAVTVDLSVLCGMLFGLAPAIQSTRPALLPALKDTGAGQPRGVGRHLIPRLRLQQALVVGQISLLMLLLVAAGLFVQTLSNLKSMPLGFNPENVLLFQLNAPQAGYPVSRAAAFYAELRRRFSTIPGVRAATLSHASLIRAGRQLPITVDGMRAPDTRFLQTGPGFFTAMQIPMLQGREIDERDREGTLPVVVISDLFARTFFPNQNPLGRHIQVGGTSPLDLEVIGVSATARYGGLKYAIPPVVYVPYPQVPTTQLWQMTYALRTDGEPLRYVTAVRKIVHEADARVPVTNVVTQAGEINQTINQEIVLARLCTAFAVLALVIACVGLYGTMAYGVVRRTGEIGIRIALGAPRGSVIWMVLREVCVLAALGLAISVPIALGTSRVVQSFLFDTRPNDPATLAFAVTILLCTALLAGYGPARRASQISPMIALRQD
jgi:macrolide transport system ATP-binding/permease protein